MHLDTLQKRVLKRHLKQSKSNPPPPPSSLCFSHGVVSGSSPKNRYCRTTPRSTCTPLIWAATYNLPKAVYHLLHTRYDPQVNLVINDWTGMSSIIYVCYFTLRCL
jgi:hypothetical protein